MSDQADLGFGWRRLKTGEISISHRGRPATTLRGDKAQQFLDDMVEADSADQQQIMARLTGNYKRGNERQARNHPRNRMR